MTSSRDSLRYTCARVATLFIGAVLVRSAAVHVENSYAFLYSIYSYDVVPRTIGVALAACLPAIQLSLGVMLLFFRRLWRTACVCSGALFACYGIVQSIAYVRGLKIACGCFAPNSEELIGLQSIGLAYFCACVAVLGVVLSRRSTEEMASGAGVYM